MKKIDAIINRPANSLDKKKTQNNTQPKTSNLKNSPSRQKQSKKAWFFSSLAIILVIILWLFGLRENWERINQKQPANNENEISSLKIKFNELFSKTSELFNSLNTVDNELINTTSTDSNIIENQPINKAPTLTDEQIKEITNELKNVKTDKQSE